MCLRHGRRTFPWRWIRAGRTRPWQIRSAVSASWAPHLPLEVSTHVVCRWRDQNLQPVKVIKRRKGSTSSSLPTTSTTSTTLARGAGSQHPSEQDVLGSGVRPCAGEQASPIPNKSAAVDPNHQEHLHILEGLPLEADI